MGAPVLLSLMLVAGLVSASYDPGATAFFHGIRTQTERTSTRSFSSYDDNSMGAYKRFGADNFNMKELKQRIAEFANPFHDALGYIWSRPKPTFVHVILFNPDTENEGIHTVEYPKGSGNNIILAFESKKECEKFSSILKEQLFYEPTLQKVKLDFLESYCKSLGVFVQVVPKDMDIRPPTESVETLGHNPNLMEQQHRLDYLFHMGDENDIEDDGIVLSDWFATSWE